MFRLNKFNGHNVHKLFVGRETQIKNHEVCTLHVLYLTWRCCSDNTVKKYLQFVILKFLYNIFIFTFTLLYFTLTVTVGFQYNWWWYSVRIQMAHPFINAIYPFIGGLYTSSRDLAFYTKSTLDMWPDLPGMAYPNYGVRTPSAGDLRICRPPTLLHVTSFILHMAYCVNGAYPSEGYLPCYRWPALSM